MAEAIEGFLVNLGFKVDQDGESKFKTALELSTGRVKQFANMAVAAVAAVGAAWLKSTADISKDFNIAHYANSSISGMRALRMAFQQVGADAGVVDQTLSSMADRARRLPGYAEQMQTVWGVSIKDANGNFRDMSIVLGEISGKMRGMSDAEAAAKAEATGLGGAWMYMKSMGFADALKESREQTKYLGTALDATAGSTNDLWKQLLKIWELSKEGFQYLVGYINKIFDLSGMLENLASWFTGGGFKEITASVTAFFQNLKDWKDGKMSLKDWSRNYQKNKDYFLADQDKMIADYEAGRTKPAGGSSINQDPDGLNGAGGDDSGGQLRTGASAPRGIRNNNPGNIRDGGRGFKVFGSRAEGFGALGRQLMRYQNSGAQTVTDFVRTWAPPNENDTGGYARDVAAYLARKLGADVGTHTAVDLRDPAVMQAFVEAITRRENGRGYERLAREADARRAIEASTRFTGRSQNFNPGMRSQVDNRLVINQQIYVKTPEQAGRVAASTKSSIAMGQRGIS